MHVGRFAVVALVVAALGLLAPQEVHGQPVTTSAPVAPIVCQGLDAIVGDGITRTSVPFESFANLLDSAGKCWQRCIRCPSHASNRIDVFVSGCAC